MYSARATLDGVGASRMRLLPAPLVLERDDSSLAGVGVVLTRWAGCNTPLDLLRITLGLAKQHGILGQAGYQLALSEVDGIHSVSACEFLALLEQRYGEVPGMPGFGFALSQATNCCQFILSHRGSELATGGQAWGPGDGESLWRWLADFC
ncbi:MAG TPA: hypothetical protein VN829_24660, partial [Dongiaceae bacterium]|nr:hypothetical protein [Dongiaceae bacterium]